MRAFFKKIFKPERVFNKQTGFIKVKTVNNEKYIVLRNRYFKLEEQPNGNYKIYDFFINLAGELEFEKA